MPLKKELEALIGRPIPNDWLERYTILVNSFAKHINPPPTTNEIRQALQNLYKACHYLEKAIPTLASRETHIAGMLNDYTFDKLELILKHREDFAWLKEQASKAIEALPKGKKGRPKEVMVHIFIRKLAEMWEEATGKKQKVTYDPYREEYTGPFFNFVKLTFNHLNIPYQSDRALAKHIKDALKTLPV